MTNYYELTREERDINSKYKSSVEEMAKAKRCREMIEKDHLSDEEKMRLKAKMMVCLMSSAA